MRGDASLCPCMWQTLREWGAANFRRVSLRGLGVISMERSAGSYKSWVPSWREDEAGGGCGLDEHLLGNLDKGFRREQRKGENRERRKGRPF